MGLYTHRNSTSNPPPLTSFFESCSCDVNANGSIFLQSRIPSYKPSFQFFLTLPSYLNVLCCMDNPSCSLSPNCNYITLLGVLFFFFFFFLSIFLTWPCKCHILRSNSNNKYSAPTSQESNHLFSLFSVLFKYFVSTIATIFFYIFTRINIFSELKKKLIFTGATNIFIIFIFYISY
jgi:hypothetical protein